MPSPLNSRSGQSLRRRRQKRAASKSAEVPSKGSVATPQDTVQLTGNQVLSISEEKERAFLKANKGKAHLVQLSKGQNKGNTVTIHGINSAPNSLQSLSQNSANKKQSVHTFVYDDRKTGLDKTSTELAAELARLQSESPGQPLTIRAHSMGGRLAVDALRKMKNSGVLGKSRVNLEMTNPVIGGLGTANSARYAPGFAGKIIPGVAPGKDMGNKSKFQKRLETTQLPKNVRTTTYVGTKDHLVKADDPHFQAVHDGLNGKVIPVKNGEHTNTIEAVARQTK